MNHHGIACSAPVPTLLVDDDDLSSSPSPSHSLSSTPSTPSIGSPQSIESADYRSMAKIRFLATKWKRRSLSGSLNRSSKDLKTLFDTLDTKDEADVDNEGKDKQELDVAVEAEAIKLEVQAHHHTLETVTSTSSMASLDDHSQHDLHESQEHDLTHDKITAVKVEQVQTPERKRNNLFSRAKRALGISSADITAIPKDDPVSVFNASSNPNDVIDKFIATGLLLNSPASVAEFFHTHPGLNKFKIGEYVGTMHNFNISVLNELVKRLDYSQVDFDIALRHLLYCFRLPGEAQKINRIMDAFGSHYFSTCTNGVFVTSDAAQIMAFSAIMLTTDAHNPRVTEKMTKQQFVSLTRGMNGEGNFPKDFLEYMFEKVVDEPLIRIDHTTTLFPYATKRGWVYLPRKKSWKKYYALLWEGTLYLQRKPLDIKWRRRITNIKLAAPEVQKLNNAPTPFCLSITGVGEGVEVAYLVVDSNRDVHGWINVLPS